MLVSLMYHFLFILPKDFLFLKLQTRESLSLEKVIGFFFFLRIWCTKYRTATWTKPVFKRIIKNKNSNIFLLLVGQK